MIPELMLRCLTIDSYFILCGNVRKLCVRKDDKALYKSRIISCPASALSRQCSAQLSPHPNCLFACPRYLCTNQQTFERALALSLHLSVPFCSIPTKLNFKTRRGCQPLDHYVVPASLFSLPVAQEPTNILFMSANLFICGSCCITTFQSN